MMVVFGSALETTLEAVICSPLASCTPETALSCIRMLLTVLLVRMSAPNFRAAAARASVIHNARFQ